MMVGSREGSKKEDEHDVRKVRRKKKKLREGGKEGTKDEHVNKE